MKCFKVTMMSRSIDGYRHTMSVLADNIESCRAYVNRCYCDLVLDIKEVKENEETNQFIEKATYIPGPCCALRSEIEEQKNSKPNTKCCPFSFKNGKMHSCQKENCMAFRHIIDGSGEYVGEYCKLIDKKGE